MKKNRIGYLTLIIALLVAYLLTLQMEFLILLLAMLLTTVLSVSLSAFSILKKELQIKVPATDKKNSDIIMEIAMDGIKNALFPEVICKVSITNLFTQDVSYGHYTMEKEGNKAYVRMKLKSSTCGCIKVHIESIGVTDVWGVVVIRQKRSVDKSINILPNIFRQQIAIENYSNTESYEDEMDMALQLRQDGEMFDIKEYEAGDSIKKIHWKLTGKYEVPMVKRTAKQNRHSVIVMIETGYFNKEKGIEPQCIDAMADTFFSIINNFQENGISCDVGWYDHGNKEFKKYTIESEEDIFAIICVCMEQSFRQDESTVLEHCLETIDETNYAHYVSVVAGEAKSSSIEHETTEFGIMTNIYVNPDDYIMKCTQFTI